MIRDTRFRRPSGALLAALTLFAAIGFPRPLLQAQEAVDEGAAPRQVPSLTEAVSRAQKLVEKIRGIAFKGPVVSAFLPEKELPKILEKKLVEDLPAPFEKYSATLVAIGLIDPEPDILKKINRLYSRQVAGFYDPSEKKFFIVPERSVEAAAGVSPLGGEAAALMEEALLTHELTHALQDQRLDLDRRMKSLKDSTDALLALQSFLEGEATVVMTEALVSRLPAESRSLLGGDALGQMMSALASGGVANIEGAEGVPEFFVKELLFPYVAGTAWIQAKRAHSQLDRGTRAPGAPEGWSAVDEAYRHLPETTSEILHPNQSFAGRLRLSETEKPRPAELPRRAHVLYEDTLGEWTLKTLLERAGTEKQAAILAATRQDDRVLFFEMPGPVKESVGFLWRIRTGSANEARQLSEALAPVYNGRAAPARPSIRVEGSVVELSRGRPIPAARAAARR